MSRRAGVVGALITALLLFLALPVPRVSAPVSTVLLDREGRLLGATVASDDQWRFPGAGVVPDKFAQAIIAAEDERFYWHPGVDPVAVVRAIKSNLSAGHVVSGASTLSMQVVRIARNNPNRTFPEKILEMILAMRLELADSKEEILSTYANNAPFGGNTVGLETAAWRYFDRPAALLSWAEAATLAVLPNSPGLIHPGRNRATLRKKRDRVLYILREDGVLSDEDLRLALAEDLPAAPLPLPQDAKHLMASGSGRVQTTLDQDLQRRAGAVLARHHQILAGGGVFNAAALILDLESGDVLAYQGNVYSDGHHGDDVDVIQAPRSTGSLLKPFLYEALLESGELLPDQIVPDVPSRIGGFAPENFDKTYVGALPASEALAKSRNVPAVWMLRQYGVDRFAARLKGLGMSTLFRPASDYGLALIVGGAEGKLWDLVGMYRDLGLSVSHAGEATIPGPARWRADADSAPRPSPMEAGAAWATLSALVEVNRPDELVNWRDVGGKKVSWKTGTSYGFRDGWAIAVTGSAVVGVWAGNADGEGRPGLTGFQAAAPILFDLLDLLPDGPALQKPALVSVELCDHSGLLAGPDCPEHHRASVPAAGLHGPVCGYCRVIQVDDQGQRVNASCASVSQMHATSWFVLPPAMEGWYTRHHPEYRPLPAARETCEAEGEERAPLAVTYPSPSAQIFVPVELDGRRGAVVLRASHRDQNAEIYWHLDDQYLGSTHAPHQLSLSPGPGEHRLTLVDEDGVRVQRRFTAL